MRIYLALNFERFCKCNWKTINQIVKESWWVTTQSKIPLFRYKERVGSRKYKTGDLCASWLSLTCAWGELTNTVLARWSKTFSAVTSHVKSMYCWYHVMRTALHHEGLLPETHNPSLILRQTSGMFKLGISDQYSLKLSMSSELRKLRNYHSS